MRRKSTLIVAAVVLLVLLALPYLIPLPGPEDVPAQSVAPATGTFLDVNGLQTYVETAGPMTGPPVVLVHGFGGSTFSWRHTIPALADAGYRVVALDLKGFGLTEKRYGTGYDHAAQAEFVGAVMDTLGIADAILIGHSMGGNVIAHFAQEMPQRARQLVFVDGAVATGDTGDPTSSYRLAAPFVRIPPVRRTMRLAVRAILDEERFRSILVTAPADPAFVTPEVFDGYYRPLRVEDWDLGLLGVIRDSGRNNLKQPVASITAPSLIIWGEEDTWVPLGHGHALNMALPQSQIVTIPGAGHLPMEEAPQAFNEALLQYLGPGTGR